MELRHYGQLLLRRWPIWVGITVLSLIFSAAYALMGPVAYETSLRLAVGVEPLPTTDPKYDPNYWAYVTSEYLADDLSEFLKSEAFAQEVSAQLGYRIDPKAISDVTRTKKTHRMLDVTISAPTAEQAQAVGQAYEQAINTKLPTYFPQLRVQGAHVTVINHPTVGRAAPALQLAGEVLLRTLVGLVLGLGLAFLVDYLDASIRDRAEAERLTGAPVLGEIPVGR
jgi:capsular polysaccharide biosynthesis protein